MHFLPNTNNRIARAFRRKVLLVFTLAFGLSLLSAQSYAGVKSDHVFQGIDKPKQQDHDRHERASKSSRRLIESHERGEDITTQLDALDADSTEIEKEEQENLKRFEQTGQKLRTIEGISTVVTRHEQALQQFRQKSGELKEHFNNIRKAKRDKASPTEITGRVKTLHDYLEKHRPRKEFDIKSTDTGLPWRMVQPGDLQILGDISQASQQGTPAASATPASVDDLSATIDVQITPEIQALAASLHNSPLEIFRYVYNNYDYTPYHGSMKGSLDTFWEKEGNDYDLASLLIALLRASNVPARYVRADVIVPIRNIQAWLGIEDPLAAAQYLAGAKIPCSFYTSGTSISHVKLEHIYVEAYIPYGNYRGTIEDDKGKAWVPMDPSFKKYTVTQSGVDFGTAMAFDWKSFSSDYLGTLQNITPLDHYKNRINDYIASAYPDKSTDELKRKTELAKMKFDFLPNTLPYMTNSIIERYSAIPSSQRHSVRFTIPGVLDYNTTLPEISGRRITLTYSGATTEDQITIDSYGGIFKTPPYLIKVIPILRIGGAQVAQGNAQNAGTLTPFSVTHSHPDGMQDPFNHNVMTGSHNAIGLTTGKVRPEFLSIAEVEPSDEVYLPKMLHSLVMKYHNSLSETRRTLNDTMRMQSRTFLTEALVSTHEERTLVLGGIPTTFKLEGFKIDAKEVSMAALPVDGKDMTKKQIDFAMTFGHEASYQENRVFEDNMFWVEGTSAVKGLQMLNAFGIQLDEPEPHTTYANANLPAGVVEDINNALNMGWHVIAPQETGGLQAIPYIKYDDKTGSAGFMIAAAAGGLANEIIDMTWVKDLWQEKNISMEYEIRAPESPYLVAMGDAFLMVIKTVAKGLGGVVAEAEASEYVTTDKNYFINRNKPIPMSAVLPGEYSLRYSNRNLFTYKVWGLRITKPSLVQQFLITKEPRMPVIEAKAEIIAYPMAVEPDIVKWTLGVTYTDNGRNDSKSVSEIVYGGSWQPDFGAVVAGNKLSLIAEASVGTKTIKGELNGLNIKGINPDISQVQAIFKDYGILGRVADEYLMCRESHYKQFKSNGTPTFGGPRGFGIMQVDPPTDPQQIWNWKMNVTEGLNRLTEKQSMAINHLSSYFYTDEQQLKETVSLYNGGYYYKVGNIIDSNGNSKLGWVRRDITCNQCTDSNGITRYNNGIGADGICKPYGVCYVDHGCP